jgi:hypothetical protein
MLGINRPDLPRLQFGSSPTEHVFTLIERQQNVPIPGPTHDIIQLIHGFFEWLGEFDLLLPINLKTAGTGSTVQQPKSGWLRILDPCTVADINTVTASINQKNQILFALKIRKGAKRLLSEFRLSGEKALANELYAKRLFGGPGSTQKIDIAVP